MLQLRAPNGLPIVGTLERLSARADISGWTRNDKGDIEAEYDGHTEVFWDGQSTETDGEGHPTLLDDEGNEWTYSECVAYDDEHEEAPAVALDEDGKAIEAPDDDGCPKGDPDCEGGDGDCHDACEAPAND